MSLYLDDVVHVTGTKMIIIQLAETQRQLAYRALRVILYPRVARSIQGLFGSIMWQRNPACHEINGNRNRGHCAFLVAVGRC